MGMDWRAEPVGPLLYAALTGCFGAAEAKRTFHEVLERCIAGGATLLLLDCRALEGEPTLMERFDFAEHVAREQRDAVESGRSLPLRIALVGHAPLIDPNRFGETVALNRGATVKVSNEMDEALRWLGIERSAVERLALAGPPG